MARKPRIEFEGAFYHVISRGNARQNIFLSDSDFQRYLAYLGEYQRLYRFRIFAYVLMTNHVHLLLETSKTPLSKIMQRLNSRFSLSFNRIHLRIGHVLQGRYQALLCDKESYLLELTRYLHLNPVRAKIVRRPDEYPWSSYHAYFGRREQVDVDTHPVLIQFGATVKAGRERYRRFVLEGMADGHRSEYYAGIEGRMLGSEQFIKALQKKFPVTSRDRRQVTVMELLNKAGAFFGKRPSEFKGSGKQRHLVEVRRWIAYVGCRHMDIHPSELARELGVDPSCISQSVRKIEERVDQPEEEETLSKLLETIEM